MTDILLTVLIVLFTLLTAANGFAAYLCYRTKKSIDLRLAFFVDENMDTRSKLETLAKVIKAYEDFHQILQKKAEDVRTKTRLR